MIVAVALGLALGIQAFLVKPFRIPSESMEPTLDVGQRVLVTGVDYHFSDPDRGDIVVFKPPEGADDQRLRRPTRRHRARPARRPTKQRSDTNFIKRIVAVGGDRITVHRRAPSTSTASSRRSRSPASTRDCEICNLPERDQDSARATTS